MKAIQRFALVISVCGWGWMASNSAVTAAEGGGIFNPFAKKAESGEESTPPPAPKSSRVSARVSDAPAEEAEESGFKWPTLPKPKLPSMPKLSLPSLTTEKKMPKPVPHYTTEDESGPSTWEKMSDGTKSFFTKTKHTLMPWTNDETAAPEIRKPAPQRRTPIKHSARVKQSSSSSESKGFFNWFSKRDEEQPQTVNEFLNQKRVQ